MARFGDAHGGCRVEPDDGSRPAVVRLVAADGATADLEVPWPALPAPGAAEDGALDPVAALARRAAASRTALLVLVRRGGAAVGLARDGALLDSASAGRYVQSRTAAGGWSQQRYARRRAGQADALVEAAVGALRRLLDRADPAPQVLVPGGDRALVVAVLADPRLCGLTALPRAPLLDVPDPRHRVLVEAARRVRAVRVRVRQRPR